MRNARVLLRRVTVVVRRREPLPDRTLGLLDALATATAGIADDLRQHRGPDPARERLVRVGADSALVATGHGLSADVVLARLRSIVVDLLECTGLDYAGAQSLVGPGPDVVPDPEEPVDD
ncbi:hypothetical protein GCM10025868_03350 [Angustibacter aerolatus]|uniref:Uncharacterized protein n=1 Tax=Angustibacter aerolatus TaxID=1162965 RepID=A0ABQ6JD06_9ACTN|nr:hypothetical protein [Angustibacter aerolatus]GMA85085.1 hypothetical protein GCM10025868_03350 [Angustibacter aerolatus]